MASTPSAISSSAWTIGVKAFERLFSLIIFIMLARLLSVEQFGVVAFSILFLEFITILISSGVKDFILTRREIDDKLIHTCTFSVVIISIIVAVVFYLLIDIFFSNKSQLMRDIFIVLLFLPIISSFNVVQVALLQRDQRFKSLSLRNLIATLISGSTALYFAYKGYGAWALVIYQYCTIIVDTIILQLIVKYRPRFHISLMYLKECYKFALPLLLSEVMNYWSTRMMDLFVSLFHGAASLAILNISRKFTRLVQQLSLSSLRPVVLSYASKSNNQSVAFAKFIAYITFIVSPILMAIGIFAEFYIVAIFGEQWRPAIKIVELLSITALAQCLTWYFGLVLISNNRTSFLFRLNIIFTVIFFVAGLSSFKLEFEHYIIVQVVLINFISLFKLFYLISKNYISYIDFKRYILPAIFSCLLFAILSSIFRLYIQNIDFQYVWLAPLTAILCSISAFFLAATITVLFFHQFAQDICALRNLRLKK